MTQDDILELTRTLEVEQGILVNNGVGLAALLDEKSKLLQRLSLTSHPFKPWTVEEKASLQNLYIQNRRTAALLDRARYYTRALRSVMIDSPGTRP